MVKHLNNVNPTFFIYDCRNCQNKNRRDDIIVTTEVVRLTGTINNKSHYPS